MPYFRATLLATNRRRRLRSPAVAHEADSAHGPLGDERPRPAWHLRERACSEDGLMLIEVLFSSLIVALIAVGTLMGVNAAQRTSISERDHNQAIALASESQEALRTAPASTFDAANNKYEHVYKKTIGGETYTITQAASFLNNAGESTSCSATNTSRQETNSLRFASTVTWPQQVAGKRAPITESSVTTPPTSSALEVDIGNYPTPTAGVPGFTSTIKYYANGSSTASTLSGTTEATGCVVFAGVPATSATVEVSEKTGYVTPAGETKWPVKEVSIAPNYTTHDPITFNEGGAIKAEFTYGGLSTREHTKNTGGEKISENVTSDGFVVYNELMQSTPNFEAATAEHTTTAGLYTPVFGKAASTSWLAAITTPAEGQSPQGNLFPFPAPGAWKVYAGACTANDPHTFNAALTDSTGYVTGGKTTAVGVPMPFLKLNVYTGAKGSTTFSEATSYPVVIKPTGCTDYTPNNEAKVTEVKEEEKTTTNTAPWPGYGGHLEHPFLALGEGTICVGPYTTGGKKYTFTSQYALKNTTEYVRNIYLEAAKKGKKYEDTTGSEPHEVKIAEASSC
jgi:Tfp pilus assembly protein PilV